MTNNETLYTQEGFWERNKKSNGYLLKKKVKAFTISLCRAVLLFGMCFLILQPLLNKIAISIMAEEDLYNPMVITVPEHFTLDHYKLTSEFMNYGKTAMNSLIIAITIAILQIAVCTLVGYGFARFEFPLKKLWFACVILIIVIPPQTISTSLHLHFIYFDILGIASLIGGEEFHGFNLSGSPLPYYLMSMGCMGLKNGLYIFMIRQFFRTIPRDIEEAAYVDGCGTLRTFMRIMLPDAKPIITSCFLFSFVWQWTDGFYSNMFLGKVTLLSIQLTRVADKLGQYMMKTLGLSAPSTGYINCIIATGTLMVIAPLILLYLFAQKGFVESLSGTGIKM